MSIIYTFTILLITGFIGLAVLLWKKSRAKEPTPFVHTHEIKSCPLCSEARYTIHMKSDAWNNRHCVELRKCASCKFVYSAQSVLNYEVGGSPFAHLTKEQLLKLANNERIPVLINEICSKSHINTKKSLDFGCGIGITSLCLQEKGFSTHGVELSTIYLERHKNLNITSTSSLEVFKDQKETFDLVVMKDVLEHVDNPVQMLQEILSYVKPGGYFYVRVPNVHHYYFHWSIDTKSHINHFSPNHLMKLLEQHNMKWIDFIGVYDVSTAFGKIYHFVFWKLRYFLPMYHQISLLYQKKQ